MQFSLKFWEEPRSANLRALEAIPKPGRQGKDSGVVLHAGRIAAGKPELFLFQAEAQVPSPHVQVNPTILVEMCTRQEVCTNSFLMLQATPFAS